MRRKNIAYYLMAGMLAWGTLASCGGDDPADPEKEDPNKIENQDTNKDPNQNQDPNKDPNQNQDPNKDQDPVPNPPERVGYTPLENEPGTMTAEKVSMDEARNPAQILAAMGMGWNLGNQMDANNNNISNETCWGNPKCTQATMDKVAAAGIKTVRIPVTWNGHIGDKANGYKIEEAWLNRVADIVDYCEKAGLNAIVNIHHDDKIWLNIKSCAGVAKTQELTVEKIKAVWTQIAEKFKDKGHFLILEGFNEVHDGGWGWGENLKDGGKQYKAYHEWLQAFVDAVRATGGKNADRWLGIPSYCTSNSLAVDALELPYDPAHKLMVAVHNYDPNTYTLEVKKTQWGHTAQKGSAETWGNEQDYRNTMKKLYDKFITKGIPVYVGEMGNCNRNDEKQEAYREYFFEFVVKCMHDSYMPAILWDNGQAGAGAEKHGYFNHGTGEWMNDYSERMVKAMVKAMDTYDDSYTLQSVYDAAPSF